MVFRLVASGEASVKKIADHHSPVMGCRYHKDRGNPQWIGRIFDNDLNKEERGKGATGKRFQIKDYSSIDEARKAAEMHILAAKPKLKKLHPLFIPGYKKGVDQTGAGEPYPSEPPQANKVRMTEEEKMKKMAEAGKKAAAERKAKGIKQDFSHRKVGKAARKAEPEEPYDQPQEATSSWYKKTQGVKWYKSKHTKKDGSVSDRCGFTAKVHLLLFT